MRARLVIIGSGTTGLCLALEAARRTDPLSAPVLLLSGSEITTPGLELCRHDLDSADLALEARHGIRFWSGLQARTGRGSGWNPCGALVEVSAEGGLSGWGRLRELGVNVRREGEKVFDDDAGTLDGERARVCLEALAREAGAVVRLGERALTVHAEPSSPLVVETTAGEVNADAVVLAGAGATPLTPGGEPELVRRTWRERSFGGEGQGVSERPGIEEEPLVLGFLPSGELDANAVAEAFQERFGGQESGRAGARARVSGDLVAAPESGGRLWVGGIGGPSGDAAGLAARALGETSQGEERERAVWEGPDGSPIVGAVPGREGVWVACGFGVSASLFAPACAEGLASRILEGANGWFQHPRYDAMRPSVNWRG
jgi:glycine/D-amino acid oxidase-like deaminating enzyme